MHASFAGLLVCLAAAGLMAVPGCGGRPDRPQTHAVRGRIVLAGQPVESADVAFVPKVARQEARPARGRTDAAGEFTVWTYFTPAEDLAGAVADEYVVVVTKVELPATAEEALSRPASSLLPSRYASPQTSGLSATVKADGPNWFEFELSAR